VFLSSKAVGGRLVDDHRRVKSQIIDLPPEMSRLARPREATWEAER
jgi:hypothetical protein